ncbi:hypothetical protein SLEP1_g3107 [Rubroshorea leprosula]|uniref:Uncharacterized protein n=1 Tax=Rubroshorea leprosula TaxID=152421 RepID=A0AAV5HQC6_9ROSI|nr:hypothetical protein SLEP1_g3107 [Rubroshorea leprosula]
MVRGRSTKDGMEELMAVMGSWFSLSEKEDHGLQLGEILVDMEKDEE